MAHTRFFEARETKASVLCVPYAQLCRRAEAVFRHQFDYSGRSRQQPK
jgi:hypothetical protein